MLDQFDMKIVSSFIALLLFSSLASAQSPGALKLSKQIKPRLIDKELKGKFKSFNLNIDHEKLQKQLQNANEQAVIQALEIYKRGGNSGGGGNTIQGKPIEAFLKHPRDVAPEAFEKLRQTVQALQEDFGSSIEFNYTLFMLEWALRKPWYFVPVTLDTLPSETVGAPLNSNQTALQFQDSVWIDHNAFSKMSVDDQYLLMLHECIMGVMILKFDSMKNLCQATGAGEVTCLETNNNPQRENIELNSVDYNKIRRTTAKLASLLDSKTANSDLAFDMFFSLLIVYPEP